MAEQTWDWYRVRGGGKVKMWESRDTDSAEPLWLSKAGPEVG